MILNFIDTLTSVIPAQAGIYFDFKDFNQDFSLGLEMSTQDILMDFLRKFKGNSHSIDRKFTQERRKMDKLTFK